MFLIAIEYWIEHLQNNLPLLQRFTKQLVLEGLSIIFQLNYFYINKSFFHQIKGMTMGIPQIYPQDFVDFLLRNYFRFLDEIFREWLENFDINQFHDLINSLYEDLKFVFENSSRTLN